MEEGKEEAKETQQKSFLTKAALEGVFSSGGGRGHLYLYVTVIEMSREHFGEYKVDRPPVPLTFKDHIPVTCSGVQSSSCFRAQASFFTSSSWVVSFPALIKEC